MIDFGCRGGDPMGQVSGIRAQGFRKVLSSTMKTILARDLILVNFSGCHKPTPLKMNLVLEIWLASKQMGKFLLQGIFTLPCSLFYSVSAPLNSSNPYFGVSCPPSDSVKDLDRIF